ncbi:MAG: hypothetical protein PHH54_07350 [Candidatus Nanoarchaeia archaeon]|nr:hypothetical protein [Candidatus Nanoarchaeia archaeon]MDD5741771.1 hypothetical protein [Candidatus Nanoarchaeia archaeon]
MGRDYQVVFEYTSEAGGYKGNRFRTNFENKEEFDKWYTPDKQKKQKVIAQGISNDEGLELCMQTPMKCRLSACLQASTDSKGGVHPEILKMEIGTTLLAGAFARQEKKR